MRLVCIADTHGLHNSMPKIPDGDVLVVAGDMTAHGDLYGVREFDDFLGRLPHPHKIVVAGNHDWYFESHPGQPEFMNAIYLQNNYITINGVKFYGSPYQPEFCDWAFNLRRGLPLAAQWAQIPDDTDVLITHGPPAGILDRTMDGQNVGCEDLLHRVREIKPKVHVFGHIHCAHGAVVKDEITFVNAAICTESYLPKQRPIRVTI